MDKTKEKLKQDVDTLVNAPLKRIKRSKKKKQLLKVKRRIFRHRWLIRSLLLLVVIFVFSTIIFLTKLGLDKSGFTYYAGLVSDFIFTPEEKVKTYKGNTNILILGKGGAGHEAPDLTDTIMFASIDHVNPSITLISLPRDIWIPELRTKLNSTYFWGNQKEPNGGIILTKSVVEDIVGQPIHYALVVDFSAFEKIIDVVGGVEIEIVNSFVDERFPVPGKEADLCLDVNGRSDPEFLCRYETVSFEKGKQFMDSESALKFVRSRNAEGDEGTDFARSVRQQLVVSAIKEKVLGKDILFSPTKLKAILQVVSENIETDIGDSTAAILARRGYDAKDLIKSHMFPEELLEQPELLDRFDNLYIFIPRKKDIEDPSGVSWAEVYEWVEGILREK